MRVLKIGDYVKRVGPAHGACKIGDIKRIRGQRDMGGEYYLEGCGEYSYSAILLELVPMCPESEFTEVYE